MRRQMPSRVSELTPRPCKADERGESQDMRLVRTIVSFAIALSVAFAPVAGGVQAHARHAEAAVTASAPAEMLDCDHHRTKPGGGTVPADDCASLAACAVKCFNYAGTTLPDSAFPPRGPALRPIMVGTVLPLALADSLFRPPRA